MKSITYPIAPRLDLVEIHHGTPVADPFRPLERADDPATVAWVEEEHALTRRVLDGHLRDRLVDRLRELHRYPRSSIPAVRGDCLFFTHNDGMRNQAVLCVREETGGPRLAFGTQRVLVDPNAVDASGTTAITAFEPSDDGTRVVYALSRRGSDAQELQIVDVVMGRDLPDRIRWVKFASIAWREGGFFYTRFPAPGSVPPGEEQYFCQVWFHRLGAPQEADRLVYHRPDAPDVVFSVKATSDGRHLVITSQRGASDKAEVHVIETPVQTPVMSGFSRTGGDLNGVRALVTGFRDAWHLIDGSGGQLFFRTDAEAPRGRIVRLDLRDPTLAPHEVIAESNDTIVDAAVAHARLLVHVLHNASSRLWLYDLDGSNRREIALPDIGTIVGIAARWHDERAYLNFMSFTTPPRIFACDCEGLRVTPAEISTTENFSSVSTAVRGSDYVTEQVWYPSKDGTSISMFLVRKRGPDPFLPAPVLLTGYGGFNFCLTPTFDPSDFLWLGAGAIVALAHARGGGEYGERWHEAGMRERKQNAFDDFIAAAEWLNATGRAAPGQIAIEGGSNGGLLVGAAMVQRPDLFGAVICRVPVADMLRYHLFTVGRFWIPEYGSADDPNQFAYLRRYSPYHNVADSTRYPPSLIMTADTDDRVDPGMAKKFAARLQEAVAADGGPILLRVETRAGHGAGKPISKQIDEQADIYSFLFQYMTINELRGPDNRKTSDPRR